MTGEQFIAEHVKSIDSSGIRRVFGLGASLPNPIDLSIGQPDFAVPDGIKRAMIEAIEQDHNGYTLTQGLPVLRERIARHLMEELPDGILAFTRRGSHCAFFEGVRAPVPWSDRVIAEYVRAIETLRAT